MMVRQIDLCRMLRLHSRRMTYLSVCLLLSTHASHARSLCLTEAGGLLNRMSFHCTKHGRVPALVFEAHLLHRYSPKHIRKVLWYCDPIEKLGDGTAVKLSVSVREAYVELAQLMANDYRNPSEWMGVLDELFPGRPLPIVKTPTE